jgi:predicted nucleotide-binding protein
MPFHVRVTPKGKGATTDEVRLDLTREQLEDRFLKPYREGRPIVIGGRTISASELERIRISHSEESSEVLLPVVREKQRRSNAITFISDDWYVANEGKDVTDEYITGPPGQAIDVRLGKPDEGKSVNEIVNPDTRSVFVVHGRNYRARDAMFEFLRSLGLQPLEFAEAIHGVERGSPYIGDILDFAFKKAQAVVVLLTSDDEARLREELLEEYDPPHEKDLTGQARPNVLFEAGMAIGRNDERTVLVQLGDVRPFSDVSGRHVVRLSDRTEKRQDIALRLKNAGCDVNMIGVSWHTAGRFDESMKFDDQEV